MLRAAEAEVRHLEEQLALRRAALEWMRELHSAQAQQEGVRRRERLNGSARTSPRKETWPARIDRVLRAAAPKSIRVADIVEALDGEGAFKGIQMVPANLIRANLKRCQEKYGWRSVKRNGVGYWTTTKEAEPAPE